RVIEARKWIVWHVQIVARAPRNDLRAARLTLARNGTRRLRCRSECCQADVVGIGESSLFAGERPDAHSLIDVEAARFDDALLQAPGLAAGILKIEIGVIHAVRHDLAEDSLKTIAVESIRSEQDLVGGYEGSFELGVSSFDFGRGHHR